MARAPLKNLKAENDALRLELEEARGALEAIRTGQVESLVVDGPDGLRIFSLEGASHSYRVLVEAMSEGAVTLSEDGTILYCNARFARLLDAPLHQVMGTSIEAHLPTASKPSFARLLRDAMKGASGESRGELLLQTRSGREVPAHISMSALDDGGRRMTCVVVTDLTQQRQEFDSILSSLSESVLVFDADGRVVRANAAAHRMLGFDAVGFDHTELGRRYKLTWPDGSAQRSEELASARALRGEIVAGMRVTLVRDGVPLEMSVHSAPLREGARVTGAISVWHDVTDFVRAQAALQESQTRLASVLEHSFDCIYRYNLRTRSYDYVSPAITRIIGFSPEELAAETAERDFGRIHPDDQPVVVAALARLEEAGEANAEYRQRAKDGSYRWVSNHMSLTRDASGEPIFRDGTLRDVTERKRAEEALRESEEKYRLIVDTAYEGIVIADRKGRCTFANQRVAEMLGYPLDEIIGKVTSDFVFEGWAPAVEQIRAGIREGRPVSGELKCRRRDGSALWTAYTTTAIYDNDGEHVASIGLHTDITKRKRGEEALRAANERLKKVLEVETVGVMFWDLTTGRMTDANDAFLNLMGYSRRDVEAGELTWQKLTPPEYVDASLAEIAKFQASGRIGPYEKEYLHKDGTRQWFIFAGSSLGGSACVEFCVDISGRKRAEEALRQSEERYRTLFESIDEGFCIIEVLFDERGRATDYRFLEMNPAFVAQTGLTDAKGRTIREMVPRLEETWFEVYGKIALTGQPARFEQEAKHLDPPRWYDVYAFRYGPAEKRQVAVLFDDIAPRKRAEEALRQANLELAEADRRKNDFLAMLSHELRNPLAPIRNSVHVMERAPHGGEQAKRAVSVIDRQVTHMARIIDDLLDVGRISRGKIRLQREPLILNDVVRGIGEDLREVFRRSYVELEVILPEEPLEVLADRTRIAQIVGNLLQNAVKFTPAGGWTTLSLRAERSEAVIQVRDSGAGIESKLLGKLFEPFIQADQTLDRSRGGLGLGLALVKGLAELHGGHASAASGGPGRGAEFTVRLPLEEGSTPGFEGRFEHGTRAAASTANLRLLIIEDHRDSASSLREVLELSGHRVDVAFTGPDGVHMARTLRPHAILRDIGLPGLDGYEVAKLLREDPAMRAVFLIALSGYTAPEDVVRSREAGFDEHMAKPPNIEALQTLLAQIPPQREWAPDGATEQAHAH